MASTGRSIHRPLFRRSLGLCLALLICLAGPACDPAAARDVDPVRPPASGFSTRVFSALRGLLERVCARIGASEDVDLVLLSSEMDARERMYFDLEGEVDLTFPALNDMLRARIERLRGERTLTDGAVCADLTVTVLERTGERSYHFEFRLGLIVLGQDLVLRLVKRVAGACGDVATAGAAGEILALADHVDPGALGDALADGMRGLASVIPKVAAGETYDAVRATGDRRQDIGEDATGHPGASMVLAHFGRALGKGLVKVGAKVAGVRLGAAAAAALSSPGGAAAGAIAGAAGLGVLGRFIYRKASVDLPMAYRLARIRRLAAALRRPDHAGPARDELARKLEKQQEHVLRRVRHESRTDRFSFLDELIDRIEDRPAAEKVVYQPLVEAVARTLRFQALAHSDRLFARKLARLERAVAAE
jgi:hypothetical protein